jgi:acyl-CoA synthetase (AMP-forming)/AMP-acid ligase II
LTWRELDDRTDRVAAGLLALGLAPGDRVASLMPTGKVDRALLVRMADPSAVA